MQALQLLILLCCVSIAAPGSSWAQPPLPTPSPDRGGPATTPVAKDSAAPPDSKSIAKVPFASLPPQEREFRRDASAAASKLLPDPPSASEAKSIVAALTRVRQRKFDEAQALQKKIANRTARTLIDWAMLKVGYGTPEQFVAFLSDHPNWPDNLLLRRRMEQALFRESRHPDWVARTFKHWSPVSSAGLAALAGSQFARGEAKAAEKSVRQAWCQTDLPSSFEAAFLARYGSHLKAADHRCRLDGLLIAHVRSRSGRAARARRIRTVIGLLPKGEQPKYTARLSMFLRQRAAAKFIAKVPAKDRARDAGFAFQYSVWLRRRKQHQKAWRVLKGVKAGDPALANRDAWWVERRLQSLHAIRAGKYRQAYDLVREATPDDENDAKDQAFFAGWLAMKHLQQAKTALKHFHEMRRRADGPLSLSKSEYWLGAAYRRLNQDEAAASHFKKAARIRDTFHGLLARARLGADAEKYSLPLPSRPTAKDAAELASSELLEVAVLTQRLGLDRIRYTLRFFRRLGKTLDTSGKFVLLAELSRLLEDGQLEVRFGKSGVAAGHDLYIYSYPVDLLPNYKPLRKPVEKAMLLGIARQESEFNPSIVSRAGARGVLQVMPITARHVCRVYRIKCRVGSLLTDTSYNAQIASAYIADRLEEFGGSYILTLTGYNAGPGRTRQWLRRFGDPRSRRVDTLDWINRIPFEETRLYVGKVLSNIQVYRARLGLGQPVRLAHDLRRGRS